MNEKANKKKKTKRLMINDSLAIEIKFKQNQRKVGKQSSAHLAFDMGWRMVVLQELGNPSKLSTTDAFGLNQFEVRVLIDIDDVWYPGHLSLDVDTR